MKRSILLVALVWVLVGCASGQDDVSQGPSFSSDQNDKVSQTTQEKEPRQETQQEPQQKTQQEPQPNPQQEPEVINLSGSGQTATDPFDLESGLAVFRMSYQGEQNFIVRLLGESGTQSGGVSLANEIGEFEGSEATQAKAGQHILDVKASGPWTITVEQPRPTSAPQAGSYAYNTGKTATDFFRLSKGLKRFTMTHQGEKNFTVWLLDKDGKWVNGGLLANEIGPFDGSAAVQVPKDDIYLLQVEADGLWSVEVEGLNLAGR